MSEILFHERLGRGGYGEVYRATWLRPEGTDRVVAVKLLNATVQRGSDAQRRLRDEARLLSSIRHPNILRVYDLVELEGHIAMVVEYVPGDDLDRAVLDGLPPRALLEVISTVARALGAAWNAPSKETGKPLRLVHRDIKPENLRIRPDGQVKILDFGVARATEMRRESETATNTVMGSFRYMAPERFDSNLQPDPSVDVFALGCILYEGLAYRRLFEHLSMREMMVLSIPGTDRYRNFIAERLEELPDSTDAKTINLLHQLVDRDPDRRPAPEDVASLCDALGAFLGGPTLQEWCTSRDWVPVHPGDGDLTGRRLDVPLKSELLDEIVDQDFTPTPDELDRSGMADYDWDAHDEAVEVDRSADETEVSLPAAQPLPVRMPAADDPTLNEAVESLTAATSTPTGSDERATWTDDEPTVQVGAAPAPPPEDPPGGDDDDVDVDDLRRAIGLNPDRNPTPPPVERADRLTRPAVKDQGAVVANVAILVVLGVVALVALALVGLVVATG
jgi:serine/threonine protein kinase